LITAVAHLAFAFCCIVWGSTFILLERVTHVFGPVEIATWRMFSGAAAVALFCLFRRQTLRMPVRDWFWIAIIAIVATAPAQIIQAYLLARGLGHGFLGTMVAAIPLLTILASVPMLGIVPSGRELVGVFGGLVCVGLILQDGVGRGVSAEMLALTALVPIAAVLGNMLVKWRLSHVSAGPLTTAYLVISGLSILPLAFSPTAIAALDLTGPTAGEVTSTAVFYLFLLGVVGSGMSTMVFTWMILKRGPLFAGMTTYVVPMLALTWGQLDHERISVQQLAAMGGVLAMVALVQFGSRRAEVDSEPVPAGLIPAAALENLCRDGPLPVAVPALAPVVSESSVPSPQPLATDPDAPTSLAC
jgi:drug/metabolite transporter (DMT)-like permease